MTQEAAVVEKKVQNQGSVKSPAKRITVKNVWEELGNLQTKIESMSAIVVASSNAKISPEILGAHGSIERITTRMGKIEENLNSVSSSLSEKIDHANSRLDDAIDHDSQAILKAQLESLNQRVELLTTEIKTAKENASHSAGLISPWWGLFSIGVSSSTAGVIVSMLSGISPFVSIGCLCVGGVLGVISALKMWLRPKK